MTTTYVRSGGTAQLVPARDLPAPPPVPSDGAFIAGTFSLFDSWAEVTDREGHYMERILPGAFDETIRRDRSRIRILYDHGQDSVLQRRPIAPLDGIGADGQRAWYFGRLFPGTLASNELAPLLKAGLLGSSFRFSIPAGGDSWARSAKRSAYNPLGLPEKTVRSARVVEVGPTPFPVYEGTTTGLSTGAHPPRSRPAMTQDDFRRWLRSPSGDSAEARAARQRWLDRVAPLPRR